MTTPAAPSFRLPEPKQCVFWEHPERMEIGRPFDCVETLIDERHLSRSLLECRECGQLYVHEFYEVVDWDAGDDKQYSTYFPVDSAEQIEALKGLSVFDILQFAPRMIGTKWIGK